MDKDRDGKLSKTEVDAKHLADFERADTNGDGQVDESEFK
jgi:hypothetical protein